VYREKNSGKNSVHVNQRETVKKLVLRNYSLLLPNDEKFNLIHQIKKCAVSIPSNIAEGSGRNHNREFVQFLGIANGSTFELITQLILAKRLKLIKEETIQPIINQLVEISNMNFSFQKTLNS